MQSSSFEFLFLRNVYKKRVNDNTWWKSNHLSNQVPAICISNNFKSDVTVTVVPYSLTQLQRGIELPGVKGKSTLFQQTKAVRKHSFAVHMVLTLKRAHAILF